MINVNKLFRRLSIRTKLVIAFVLLGVVPVGLVGGDTARSFPSRSSTSPSSMPSRKVSP